MALSAFIPPVLSDPVRSLCSLSGVAQTRRRSHELDAPYPPSHQPCARRASTVLPGAEPWQAMTGVERIEVPDETGQRGEVDGRPGRPRGHSPGET